MSGRLPRLSPRPPYGRLTIRRARLISHFAASFDLVKLPKLKTPFSADLERPTNVRTKVVIAAALAGQVEPRAGDVRGSSVAEIGRLGLGWRRVQAMKVSLGVVTANGIQYAFP